MKNTPYMGVFKYLILPVPIVIKGMNRYTKETYLHIVDIFNLLFKEVL